MALESPSAALRSFRFSSNHGSPCLLGSASSLSCWINAGGDPIPCFLTKLSHTPLKSLHRGSRRFYSSPMAMASFGGLLGSMFKGSDTGDATRKQYSATLSLINEMEPQISSLSDSQLREKTAILQERASNGDSLDSLLPVSLFGLLYF